MQNKESKFNRKHNIDYLYHMTHIDNLSSIFVHGFLSYNKVCELGLVRKDISDEIVQERRHKKRDPINNKPLHDYVCLYFNPRNPMLYKLRHLQKDIVILGIDKRLLREPKTSFTDGNAASDERKTTFYGDIENLDKLDWEIINAKYWIDEEGVPDRRKKRIKCAEILIYQKIPVEKIQKIFCYSKEQCSKVYETILDDRSIQIKINKNLYF